MDKGIAWKKIAEKINEVNGLVAKLSRARSPEMKKKLTKKILSENSVIKSEIWFVMGEGE